MADHFTKFTDRARAVLTGAQEAAMDHRHDFIDTEHLLLALLADRDSAAVRVLERLGVEADDVRSVVGGEMAPAVPGFSSGEIGLRPGAKQVIELAVFEARETGHIGTEHLLLGLLSAGDGIAARLLAGLGVDPDRARAEAGQVAPDEPTPDDRRTPTPTPAAVPEGRRFDRFTERARRTLTLAQEEAQRFNHNYIGGEHILLGMIREEESVAVEVLRRMGTQPQQIRRELEARIRDGASTDAAAIGLTPLVRQTLELAVAEARQLGHDYIGTEHLLLGLLRAHEAGQVASVLHALGVDLESARAEVRRVLEEREGV